MSELFPTALYTGKQVRELDRLAIEVFDIDGFELMKSAAEAALKKLTHLHPDIIKKKLQVFCGGGNNGGDGYIIAALAQQQNITVSVIALKDPGTLKGDARKAYNFSQINGVDTQLYNSDCSITGDIIVDAMLGTGLNNDVSKQYQQAIELINNAQNPVFAIDIPSGLCAETGTVLGAAIKATHTLTFIGLKQGLYTAMGPDHCGQLSFSDLAIPEQVYTQLSPSSYRLSHHTLHTIIRKRPAASHKGHYGHVLIIGGNYSMAGAVIMAAEAAMAVGAGKVTVITRKEHVNPLTIRRPEVMTQEVNSPDQCRAVMTDKTAIVIGPGLSQDEWSLMLLKTVLTAPVPVLLDADALNLIAKNPKLMDNRNQGLPTILTPHAGEAARLLQCDASTVQRNRFSAVNTIKKQFNVKSNVIIVLKGAGTLIHSENEIQICTSGNAGMAVAGMGDVLSGVIGALAGQQVATEKAVALGVWLHSAAADLLVEDQGEIGVLATALIAYIRSQLNRLVL